MSGVLVFLAAPVLAAAVALGWGVSWLASPRSRRASVARYPLATVTWIIVAPLTVLACAAVYFGLLYLFDDTSIVNIDGSALSWSERLAERFGLPALGLVAAILGALVLVMAHLRARREPWPRYAMLGVAAVPIAAVLYAVVMLFRVGDAVGGAMAMILAFGSIANALLARPAQEARQASRDAPRAGASATTELAPPPPAPPAPPAP